MGVLVIFGAVPIVYQGKHYIKRYRARKLFEQDFANQIKMTRNGSNKNPENIATATYGQELHSGNFDINKYLLTSMSVTDLGNILQLT